MTKEEDDDDVEFKTLPALEEKEIIVIIFLHKGVIEIERERILSFLFCLFVY